MSPSARPTPASTPPVTSRGLPSTSTLLPPAGGWRPRTLTDECCEPTARIDYTGMPSVVFTRPQLASAGLTEKEVLTLGNGCVCRVLNLSDVPRAVVNRDTRGMVKVVADPTTGKVLGVHALADGAGEIMLAATYAIKAGMTVDDIADTWAPYLTMAESLRIVAGLFRNQMPTSCCA